MKIMNKSNLDKILIKIKHIKKFVGSELSIRFTNISRSKPTLQFFGVLSVSVFFCFFVYIILSWLSIPEENWSWRADLLSFVIGVPATLAVAFVAVILSEKVARTTELQEQWDKLTYLRETSEEVQRPFIELGRALTQSFQNIRAVNRSIEKELREFGYTNSYIDNDVIIKAASAPFKNLKISLSDAIKALHRIQFNELAHDIWSLKREESILATVIDKWEWVATHETTEHSIGHLRPDEEGQIEEDIERQRLRLLCCALLDNLVEELEELVEAMSIRAYVNRLSSFEYISQDQAFYATKTSIFQSDPASGFRFLGYSLLHAPSGYVLAEGRKENPYDHYRFNIGGALLADIVCALPSGEDVRDGLCHRLAEVLEIKKEGRDQARLVKSLSLVIPSKRKPVPQLITNFISDREAVLSEFITVEKDDPDAVLFQFE
jgi:hypothetical protein